MQSSVADVAVIIPVFNRSSVVLDALESVANQTLRPRQLIVVDDGSTDGSAEAVSDWMETTGKSKIDECKLCRCSKSTAAAARQYAFQQIESATFVAFLDSDDLWPGDFLVRGVTALLARPNAVAASADRYYIDSDERCIATDDCLPLANQPIDWIFRHGGGIASCTLVRRDAVAESGGWEQGLVSGEDAMLYSNVALLGDWIHLPGQPVVFRHGNAAQKKEEVNLSQKHVDSLRRWAFSYEIIYDRVADQIPKRQRRQLQNCVATYWYRAGKQLQSAKLSIQADACYAKSIGWRPLQIKSRIKRARLHAVSNESFAANGRI